VLVSEGSDERGFARHELANAISRSSRVENVVRPVVPARKNCIHFKSREVGPSTATFISIVETCRRLKIPVRDYLSHLPGLADFPVNRTGLPRLQNAVC
jgi:hypothetical protein